MNKRLQQYLNGAAATCLVCGEELLVCDDWKYGETITCRVECMVCHSTWRDEYRVVAVHQFEPTREVPPC